MATLPPTLIDTLHQTAYAMSIAQDDWWIIASAAVALHGADAGTVGDVDLLVSRRDACRLLARLAIPAIPDSGTWGFRSAIFARWLTPPLPVEIMADFEHCDRGAWAPVLPSTRERIDLPNTAVFVPSVDELVGILHRFGRPKDRLRADALLGLHR